jgi:hypothetical protein
MTKNDEEALDAMFHRSKVANFSRPEETRREMITNLSDRISLRPTVDTLTRRMNAGVASAMRLVLQQT